jgi:hypothetical protein
MTPSVTQDPEVTAMVDAAWAAQLPPGARAFWPLPQVTSPEGVSCAVPIQNDETTSVGKAAWCACGCGMPVTRAQTGRPARYVSGAHRMRALRARRRAAAVSRPGPSLVADLGAAKERVARRVSAG